MKRIIVVFAINFTLLFSNEKEIIYCAHYTPNKDTLYLLKNDTMSNILYSCWQRDTNWKGNNPTIVLLDSYMFFNVKMGRVENFVK
jgi:hypothetical protein